MFFSSIYIATPDLALLPASIRCLNTNTSTIAAIESNVQIINMVEYELTCTISPIASPPRENPRSYEDMKIPMSTYLESAGSTKDRYVVNVGYNNARAKPLNTADKYTSGPMVSIRLSSWVPSAAHSINPAI